MGALAADAPTSGGLGFPSRRGADATPLSRSARLRAAVALTLAAALGGCEPYVQGNGVYHQETRPDPGPFTGLHVESGIEVTVTAGAADRSVVVSGDANVVPYLETVVQTGEGRRVLFVRITRTFSGTIPPRAAIAVPSLEYAFATQFSRISGKTIAASSFEVVADHGANVVLEGAAAPAGDSISAALATGALLNATAYEVSGGAAVTLTGGSIAKLHADGPVTGTLSGGSQLDNLSGTGVCADVVVQDAASKLSCH